MVPLTGKDVAGGRGNLASDSYIRLYAVSDPAVNWVVGEKARLAVRLGQIRLDVRLDNRLKLSANRGIHEWNS